jgi:uncharacterized protein (DUF924 family)
MEWQKVIQFWFKEAGPEAWFNKDAAFDQELRDRFGALHEKARHGELFQWRENMHGRLAEILVLDQFSRNMFRDQPQSFAQDGMALALAQEALRDPGYKELPVEQRAFLYMPFMHSESRAIHEIAVKLFSEKGLEQNLKFEFLHKEIIDRFGRYPHRNEVLGRQSTPEEIEYLKNSNIRFYFSRSTLPYFQECLC